MKCLPIITLDGPAGVGKSTLAKRLATILGIPYLDTGAMFRTIALRLGPGAEALPEDELRARCKAFRFKLQGGGEHSVLLCNGVPVGPEIRTEEVGQMASKSAAVPQVRSWLIDLQRDLAVTQNVIMDGRDIGTCVLPQATVKIYLTASANVRAKRRYDEYRAKGMDCDYEEILNTVKKRDMQDMTRAIAPLKQADDAVLLDTSDLSIEEVVDRILEICAEKGC